MTLATPDLVIQNINKHLVLCQKLDIQLVQFQNYICCTDLARQLNIEKQQHVHRFFSLQQVVPVIKQLNSQIQKPNFEGNIQFTDNNTCYFKLINEDKYKQYNGYYIHQDLYMFFVLWLNPEKYLKYQQFINSQMKLVSLQGITDLQEIMEEQKRQLEQKDQTFRQFIENRSINKIYYMTNKSLPGVCKLGTSQNPTQRAINLNTDPNYKQDEKWECQYFVSVLNGLYAENVLKQMEQHNHIKLELYKDMGIEHYKKIFQIIKEDESGLDQPQDQTLQQAKQKITYAQAKQSNLKADQLHYVQMQVKKYNLADSNPETIRNDIINTKNNVGLQLRVNAFNFYFPELKINLENKIQQEKERKVKIRILLKIHKLQPGENPQQIIKNDIQKRIDQRQIQGVSQYINSYSSLFPEDAEFSDKIRKDVKRLYDFNTYMNTIYVRNNIKERTFQTLETILPQERLDQIKNTALRSYGVVL